VGGEKVWGTAIRELVPQSSSVQGKLVDPSRKRLGRGGLGRIYFSLPNTVKERLAQDAEYTRNTQRDHVGVVVPTAAAIILRSLAHCEEEGKKKVLEGRHEKSTSPLAEYLPLQTISAREEGRDIHWGGGNMILSSVDG